MPTYLDVRTAIATVEQALVDALSLAFLQRPEVADLDALRAATTVPTLAGLGDVIPDGALRFVVDQGVCYRWRKFSTNPEVLPTVLVPADRQGVARGRWERCSSTVTYGPAYFRPLHRQRTGYAKAVQLWQGDELSLQGMERIFAAAPAFIVGFLGDAVTMAANNPRGLNDVELPFRVYCYSRNYRQEPAALEGSQVASEAAADPGLYRMMGDVRYVLADATLGLSPGVRYTDIQGEGSIDFEDLSQRRFIGSVPILVKASWNIPDEDLQELTELWIQFQAAQGNTSGTIDAANHVTQGLRIPVSRTMGLAGTPAPGAAYVGGKLVTVQPGSHVFTAERETYRWLLQDGSLFYRDVELGADAPEGPAGALLVGKTLTDASDITYDALLCDYLIDDGEPFRVGT